MNKKYIYQEVRNVIADHYDIKIRKVDKNSNILLDFEGDSLDFYDIMLEIEDAFQITIDKENKYIEKYLVKEWVEIVDKIVNRS